MRTGDRVIRISGVCLYNERNCNIQELIVCKVGNYADTHSVESWHDDNKTIVSPLLCDNWCFNRIENIVVNYGKFYV